MGIERRRLSSQLPDRPRERSLGAALRRAAGELPTALSFDVRTRVGGCMGRADRRDDAPDAVFRAGERGTYRLWPGVLWTGTRRDAPGGPDHGAPGTGALERTARSGDGETPAAPLPAGALPGAHRPRGVARPAPGRRRRRARPVTAPARSHGARLL